jgi:carboxyl-terminal processing protease
MLFDFSSHGTAEMTWLLAAAWKTTLLFLTAGTLTGILSRRSAALRHLVWTTAFLGALVVPILDVSLPGWNIACLPGAILGASRAAELEPSPAPNTAQPTTNRAVAMLEGSALDQSIAADVSSDSTSIHQPEASPARSTESVAAATASPPRSWHYSQIAPLIWLAGVAVLLARVLAGFMALKRLARRTTVVENHSLNRELLRLAHVRGIDHPIRLGLSPAASIPMTWGLLRPAILLPRDATAWPADRIRVVLLHELAHIARRDYLTQLFGTLARALHWYNPLAWWALAQMKAEQEQSADDCVLNAGMESDVYACELLKVTSQYPHPQFTPSAALAIGRSARIQRRLETILDDSRDRRPLSPRAGIAVAVAALVILAVVAPLHVVAAGDNATQGKSSAAAQHQDLTADPAKTATAVDQESSVSAQPVAGAQPATEPSDGPGSSLSAIRSAILNRNVKPIDSKGLDEGAIRGMLQALNDRYAEYLTHENYQALLRSVEGTLSGIGVQVAPAESQLNVIAPVPGSPAQSAGLVAGDAIVAIDGKTVRELGGTAAIEAIRGTSGTAVSLKVQRTNGEEAILSITRRAIHVPTIRGLWTEGPSLKWNYWLDPQQKLGFVQFAEFGRETVADCREVVTGLLAEGMKGLVLDLRGCPGGLLTAAVEAANLFLRQGTIVTTRGADPAQAQTFTAQEKMCLGDFPVIVIVDDHTASAAEILAGALKDNGRATILGMRTFGKGSVQELMRVAGGGAIKLTTAYFYMPSGRRIDREKGAETWGIDPTEGYTVTLTPDQQAHRIKQQQTFEQMGDSLRGTANGGSQAVSAALENILGDLQLVAAYKCLAARIAGGGPPAGVQSEQSVKDAYARRERLLKARAEAQLQIEQIDKELSAPRSGR